MSILAGPQNVDSKSVIDRQLRFSSHALVEIKAFRHLPFGVKSAVLLDISLGGFKVEFTGEAKLKPGQHFWMSIPLTPLGIYAPSRLTCRGETRWFDGEKFRLGGVFMQLTRTERLIIDQVIETLKQRGSLNR